MLDNDPLWYKDAIIYQVHVRTFHDSVGDGVGDFRGLTQKLDYLEDLGVTAVWVQPFYPSPLKDDGYDIAEYTSIHPRYGRLADFREFLDAAHRRGIRVVTELVINHTSDQHSWFRRARLAPPGSPERDFYVWSDTPDKYANVRIIFKDFERSNWTWDPVAKAYFWHRFYAHQPDLNYDNPAVWEAIFPVVDFWLGMGVDGMRLDAVPYLFEREGTSCENLPETHAFLRALRAHVDAKYTGRMLLAEANQWPEDAIAYLGQGDECQMAFHFPVMPRLFMALHMEDRFPVLDIMDQTPPIPDNCQWCMFLRNHDELTLEMVTDEERDYMYRAYAQDTQARINLGIRRRLTPLLRNDRRRIELMKALLFALPGTPVLYYGDEIGMGDNIYLGDRNGVRTPMQWSGDRNAGFSRANPQKLYLPVIIDPEYHYESVNVETQQNNPSSLLWWMKRLIALRKRYKAFGRGTLEFLKPQNPKILAFLRRYSCSPLAPGGRGVGGEGEEIILVVANLSRFVQYVELDLRAYRGLVPEELFGKTAFPPVGDGHYLMTLGPHAFYWFALAERPAGRGGPSRDGAAELPTLEAAEGWEDLFENSGLDRLEELLPAFVGRRWPGGPARLVRSAVVLDAIPVRQAGALTYLLRTRAEYDTGETETVLLPLTLVPEGETTRLLESVRDAGLARVVGPQPGVLCDALATPAYCRAVLGAILAGRSFAVGPGEVAAVPLPGLAELADAADGGHEPVLSRGGQSNTSVVYGGRLIHKAFRRVDAGVNPDVEVGRFLTEQGFAGAAPVVGYVEYRPRQGEPTTLAVLHRYVANEGSAWQLTLDHLSQFFEQVAALPKEVRLSPPGPLPLLGPAEPDPPGHPLHEAVGGYLGVAQQLGRRAAEMHAALAADRQDPRFAPEAFTRHYQRSLYQAMRNLTGQVCDRLAREADQLSEPARGLAGQVLARRAALLERVRAVMGRSISGWRIRVHGDYHLGHLLHTGSDFVVTDFEGDLTGALSERRIKRSPLHDVANLVRSFHYAAYTAVYGLDTGRGRSPGVIRGEDLGVIETWAGCWYNRVARAFVTAYAGHARPEGLLPDGDDARRTLLEVMLLDKALREVGAELDARHDWLPIPLRGVLLLLDG